MTTVERNEKNEVHAGNGKVGDHVIVLHKNEWRDGRIMRVGARNENGYRMNVIVKVRGVRQLNLSPHDDEHLVICAPADELPNKLWALAVKYGCLVARVATNSDNLRYRLVCQKCYRELSISRSTNEHGKLVWRGGQLTASYHNGIDDIEEHLSCECPTRESDVPDYEELT